MANNNKMNIIEALVQLRNDLKLWVTNNLRVKMDKNLGADNANKILSVDENGDIVTSTLTASDVGALPADTTFASLPGAPDITQDPEDKVLYVVDDSGNIIARVDTNGLAVTTVTTNSVVLNGADVQATYATKQYVDDAVASSGGGTGGGVSKEYVDNAVAQKSQVQFITWEADD